MSDWVADASAIIAFLHGEPGGDSVLRRFGEGQAIMSAVNLSEVVARWLELGRPEEGLRREVDRLGIGLVPFDQGLAFDAGAFEGHSVARG